MPTKCLATFLVYPTLCSSSGLLTLLHLAKLQRQLFVLLETSVFLVFLDLADLISKAVFQIWKSPAAICTTQIIKESLPLSLQTECVGSPTHQQQITCCNLSRGCSDGLVRNALANV